MPLSIPKTLRVSLVTAHVFLLIKSEVYWPAEGDTATVIPFQIHNVRETDHGDYVERTMKLLNATEVGIVCCSSTTVNSEIFASVLFSRNFAYAKFHENKALVNGTITLSFTDKGKSCLSGEFIMPQICSLALFA